MSGTVAPQNVVHVAAPMQYAVPGTTYVQVMNLLLEIGLFFALVIITLPLCPVVSMPLRTLSFIFPVAWQCF